ncbi:MAG TPA: type II toxin-antitoxin system Phd/YefM family antitoxin [Dehalococcoidia bacterium]|nr:type II toxin-antitoxin system Phd/YefM family antitoxin [Dehalococcoidia bacterium]
MQRRVSAVEARQRLGELLEGVFYRDDEIVIERAGKPMAVLIPAERYDALRHERERFWKLVEEAQERQYAASLAEIEADVQAAIAEVRGNRHAAGGAAGT